MAKVDEQRINDHIHPRPKAIGSKLNISEDKIFIKKNCSIPKIFEETI